MRTLHRVVAVAATAFLIIACLATQKAAAASHHHVNDDGGLRYWLANAQPGDVIHLAPRTYTGPFVASANGTQSAKITLTSDGQRDGVVLTNHRYSGIALHVTGSHWTLNGISVTRAEKGIMFDRSEGSTVDWVKVYDIGHEAIHFRTCSRWGVVMHSDVRDTGKSNPEFGEGVYIGSSHNNWSKYQCANGRDESNNVTVRDTTIANTTAEAIDIKEGTFGGWVHHNTMSRYSTSDVKEFLDSAVDIKGSYYTAHTNVLDCSAPKGIVEVNTANVWTPSNNSIYNNTVC